MAILRTSQGQKLYDDYQASGGLNDGCNLCKAETIKQFEYWRIIPNKFPYDKVAKTHHMIIPIRHTDERGLDVNEKEEILNIKPGYISDNYQYMLEATNKMKSIPEHYHIHALVIKEKF